MKLRAKQNAQAPDQNGRMTYRRGPEYDLHDKLIDGGEVFDVPDEMSINPDVFEVVEGPARGKANVAEPQASSHAAKK